jgi:hypothetical protein
MEYGAGILGLIGFVFTITSYSCVDELEKTPKELGVLEKCFNSE